MAPIDMRCVCLNSTHTPNCQHNVTLASQVERWSSSASLFFFFACYLIMKARWWRRNAPVLISQHFLPWQHNFRRLSVYVSRSRCRVCLHLPHPIWMKCLRSVIVKSRGREGETGGERGERICSKLWKTFTISGSFFKVEELRWCLWVKMFHCAGSLR